MDNQDDGMIKEEDRKKQQEQRNLNNNIKNVRNATDVAIVSGNPVAAGIGTGVKAVDKVTDGKASEAIGKSLTTASKITPGGNHFQRMSNRLSESGISDSVGKVSSLKSRNIGATSEITDNSNKSEGKRTETLPSNTATQSNQNITSSSRSTTTSSNNEADSRISSTSNNKSPGHNTDRDAAKKENSNKTSSSLNPLKENSQEDSNDDNNDSEEDKNRETKSSGVVKYLIKNQFMVLVISAALLVIGTMVLLFSVTSIIESMIGQFGDMFHVTTSDDDEGFYSNIDDDNLKEFLEEVKTVYNESFISYNIIACKPEYVVAVFHIIYEYDPNIYQKISTNDIKEVFWASVKGDFYNEDVFKEKLKETILPKYLNDSEYDYEVIVNDIFEFVENFYNLADNDDDEITCDVDIYTCDYKKGKGYYAPKEGLFSRSKNYDGIINISNIFVKLMKCNSISEELPNEKLIPFEKYVLGLTYAVMDENTPYEAVKAQAVVARDYALRMYMDQIKNKETDSVEARIFTIDSCDGRGNHPYCDADQGCSIDYDGNYCTGVVLSESNIYKEPLPADSNFRRAVAAVNGVTLMNEDNYILAPDYSKSDSKAFISLANKGNRYNSILLSYYSKYGARNLVENKCDSVTRTTDCVSDGKYAEWKQKDPQWANTPIGQSGSTLGEIGCLVTAVSMQIAKSGVKTRINNFNPGTFVEFLNNNNGFDRYGNFQWNAATVAAPSFKYMGQISLSGLSQSEKLAKISAIASQAGAYAVVEVKGSTGQHWVAIDSVKGNKITIMDAGKSNGTNDLWTDYKWPNTSTIAYYKVDRSNYAK